MTANEHNAMHVELAITFRLAARGDLPKLEWYGQYTHFRAVFQRTFAEQERDERLMLLADVNGFPIGQIFIQLNAKNRWPQDSGRRVYFYSLRVMEMFQGLGIGTRLIHEAEQLVTARRFNWSSIGVAKTNAAARRLYERLGYAVFREEDGRWNYVDHQGRTRYVHEPCWLLEKRLARRKVS